MTHNAKKLGVELEERRTSRAVRLNGTDLAGVQGSKQVVSYLGLNPRESSSGGRQRLGAISKQGNSMARYLLVEAAQTAAAMTKNYGGTING